MDQAYLAALVSCAMGLAFISADPHTPTSRALSAALGFCGLSIAGNTFFFRALDPNTIESVSLFARLVPVLDAIAILLAYEWIARLRATIPPDRELNLRFGDRVVRVAQGLVLIYLALALCFPVERVQHFLGALSMEAVHGNRWFLAFSAPLDLSALLAAVSMLLLLNRRPDAAERTRLLAMCFAMPVIMLGLVLPIEYAPYVTIVGEMVLLVGAVQYHVAQGRRSEFLGRFLSPSVAGMVRRQGLESVRRETRDISVVSCDIRGFTNRCRSLESEEILELLREFYARVGECCQRHEATIKDYAGDGVLMLVGAPMETAATADQALALAHDLQSTCRPFLQQWSLDDAPLGLAVGIASGPVTLGVIGGLRLEYVAVGSTVNLAARLCESAGAGETLLDTTSAQATARADQQRELDLKGFGPAVPVYAA